MRKFVAFGMTVLTILAIMRVAQLEAADNAETLKRKAEMQRIKGEHQRRLAEIKRSASGPAEHRGLPPSKASGSAPARDFRGNAVGFGASKDPRRDFRGNAVSANGIKRADSPPPFNAASAPPPVESLANFVKTTRSASAMNQLLNFLPAGEAETLKEMQTRYDPKEAAASQKRWRETNPGMKEESITYLTNPPFTNKLDHLKQIADKIIDVLQVKVEGNKATLIVATKCDAVIDGGKWPFSKATVELVGEGSAWKLSSYNDSNIVYQEKPTAP